MRGKRISHPCALASLDEVIRGFTLKDKGYFLNSDGDIRADKREKEGP